tara:strand:+ start:73 stop:831 length:759 start_codon:yes stop_codon:yes gene_type:complete
MTNNTLILAAHPDDEVVGLSIKIRELIKSGSFVYIFYLTNGVISKDSRWFWEKKNYTFKLEKRIYELEQSMKLLGIRNYKVQQINSRTIKNNLFKTFYSVNKIIKKYKIKTIFTPAYEGGHQDHDLTNFIASKFKKNIRVYEYPEYNFFNRKILSNTFFKLNGNETIYFLNEKEKIFKKKLLNIYVSEQKNLSYLKVEKECLRPISHYNYLLPAHIGTLFYRRFAFFSWHPRVDSTSFYEIKNKIIEFNRLA